VGATGRGGGKISATAKVTTITASTTSANSSKAIRRSRRTHLNMFISSQLSAVSPNRKEYNVTTESFKIIPIFG
jgi:hypothetical protein